MKKSGLFAVSVAAASAAAASASSSSSYSFDSKFNMPNQEPGKPMSSDKFVPRYDGLRFIETLVTGHR